VAGAGAAMAMACQGNLLSTAPRGLESHINTWSEPRDATPGFDANAPIAHGEQPRVSRVARWRMGQGALGQLHN